MDTDALKILVEKIRGAKSILIAGHKNPDGDSMCSVLALGELIKLNFNKDALCVYDGNVPDMLDNVPLREKMHFCGRVNLSKPFDLVFVLDYGNKTHIGAAMPVVESAKYVIEIDHHKNDDTVGDLCLNNTDAAAVGEILFDIAAQLKWKRNSDVNDLITVSVLTDTGSFKYARRGDVLRIMAQLVDEGVKIEHVSNLLNNKPRKTVLTEASVASRCEFFYRGRLALATIDAKDYKNLDGRGEIVLSLLGQIKGVEYIVLLKRQKENQTGVSLRSKTHPVNEIAQSLGGGGHLNAAGAVVQDTLENVRNRILEIFRGVK